MKKIVYCCILGFWGWFSQAQNQVTQAEYFWDTDPGEGNATAVTAADGNFDNALENLMSAADVPTTPGLHTFGIRVKDNTGVWSPVFKNTIHFGNTTTANYALVAQAEYFWDTDPGEGNATVLTAEDGNFDSAIESILQNTANVPAPTGFHTLNVRLRDNTGAWGPIFKNVVHTGNSPTANYSYLTEAEYFWDTDPGEGNGTAVTAADGNYDDVMENVLDNSVGFVAPIGLHTFNLRVKDVHDVWGPVFKNTIYIETTLANEDFDLSTLIVYPNPVKNILNVSSDQEIATVAIYNMLGQGAIEKAVHTMEGSIDVSRLSAGTYIVKITAGNQIKTLKVVKE